MISVPPKASLSPSNGVKVCFDSLRSLSTSPPTSAGLALRPPFGGGKLCLSDGLLPDLVYALELKTV